MTKHIQLLLLHHRITTHNKRSIQVDKRIRKRCAVQQQLHEWAKPALCVCVLWFYYKLFIAYQIVIYPIREECSSLHVKMTIRSSLYPAMHTSRLLDVAQPLTRVASQFFLYYFKFQCSRHRHFFFFFPHWWHCRPLSSSPFTFNDRYAEKCVYDWEMSFTLCPSLISFEFGYLHWSSSHRDAYIK